MPVQPNSTPPASTLERMDEAAAERNPLPADAVPADVEELRSGGFSLRDKFLNVRSLISFGLAFGLIAAIFLKSDVTFGAMWAQVQTVNWFWYALAFISFYALFPLRAWRWRIILRGAGFEVDSPAARRAWTGIWPLSEFIGLSWFANCVVPAKLGDAYRGYLVRKNGGASFSRTFGTIFAERIIDMIVLFGMLVVSGFLVFRGHFDQRTELIFIVGVLLMVVLVVGLMSMRYLSPLIRRVLPSRYHDFYARFEEGTLASFRPRQMPLLLVLTVLVWFGEALRLLLVITAMGGFNLSLSSVIFVALSSSLLTAVPALPGGLGLVEVGIVSVLSTFGVSSAASTAIALLDRVINFWSIIICGLLLYLFSKRK